MALAGAVSIRVVTPVLSRQLLQQRLRLLEIGGGKPLGEPAIGRREQLAGLRTLILLLPQTAQAHGCPEFQRFRLLAAGYGQSLPKASFRLGDIRKGLLQAYVPCEPIELPLPPALCMSLRQ